MLVELPFATAEDLAEDFRPGKSVRAKSALETLRKHDVLSEGIAVPVQGPRGLMRGQLRVFSNLARDAARLEGLGQHTHAVRVAKKARKLEKSTFARAVAKAMASAQAHLYEQYPTPSLVELAQEVLRDPEMASALEKLNTESTKARREVGLIPLAALGRVESLGHDQARVSLGEVGSLPIPRKLLSDPQLGDPVTVRWIDLGRGVWITAEPAVELPGEQELFSPPPEIDRIYPFVRPLGEIVEMPADAKPGSTLKRSGRIAIES